MTLTDQPRFGGSELRMSRSVDRVVALRVFESERGMVLHLESIYSSHIPANPSSSISF